MNYAQMKQTLKDVELIERDLMRDLTEDEKNLTVSEGWKALLYKLHLNDTNYKILKDMRHLISVLFTKPDEEYAELVKTMSPVISASFRRIADDIDAANTEDEKVDPIEDAIKKLKSGETLELDSDVIDKVIDKLWETETNVRIEVRNNKIRLR